MITFSGNHYGTPKPSPDSPAKTDTVIPGAHPSSEVSLIMSLLTVILMMMFLVILMMVFLVIMMVMGAPQ